MIPLSVQDCLNNSCSFVPPYIFLDFFSVSVKNGPEIFIGIALKLHTAFGRVVISPRFFKFMIMGFLSQLGFLLL